MRRIKIDNDLISFAKDFSQNLFNSRNSSFIKPKQKILDLKKEYAVDKNSSEFKFLDYLTVNNFRGYEKTLTFPPSKQVKLIRIIDLKFPELFVDGNNKTKRFSEELQEAFRYKALRDYEGIKIVDKLGTKTCAYCNAQLAVSVDHNGKKKARLELDHFFPKNRYPYLSTSFFNLIPSCSPCNRSKSKAVTTLETHFHLYTEKGSYDQFQFRLSKKSELKYWKSKRVDDIEILFEDHPLAVNKQAQDHNDVLGITALFDTQKDIIEEMIEKYYMYSASNRKFLIDEFSKLFPDKDFLYRMIVGNYSLEEDIHKRPLAKFMQDIAKDLKLDQLLK